jgi:glycosyltransferase involved in cell wall biosynthesis
MKLTILHLIPTLEGGGAERQLSMLAAEESRRGATVHVGSRRGGFYFASLCAHGVSMHSLGDHRAASPRLLGSINSLLKTIQPDIVQTWLPQMDVLGGMACLWRAIPWVLSERVSERAFRRSSALLRARRLLGRHASAIVANSAAGASYWRAAMPLSQRVDVVRNAVDISAIRRTPGASGDLAHDAAPLLLVVGRLHRQKAVEVVLQAVSRVAATLMFRVLVVGDGPQRSSLEGMVRDLGLGARVVMLPYQRDWWGLLKLASALVSVSRYEGHPNVVLESMAAGCPLIVSDIQEHREFLNETSAVLVPPEDPAALAQAIATVLQDEQAARVRALVARDRLSDLTVEAMTDGYERVYQQVLKIARL